MQAPVVSYSKESAFMLDFSDVTFIQLGDNRRDILLATYDTTLRLVRSIQEMAAAVDGSDFIRVNQDIIVNMERARYDYDEHQLLFHPSGSDQISSCQVSRDNRAKVRKWFTTY